MLACDKVWRKVTGKYEKFVMKSPKTCDEFIDMAGKFAALIEDHLLYLESLERAGDIHTLALALPRIIGPLNAIYSLRGDHGGFGDKICTGKKRNQLREIEDVFEKRIARLVLAVQAVEKEMQVYEELMKKLYFMNREYNARYANISNR